jgi:hypothetical protein
MAADEDDPAQAGAGDVGCAGREYPYGGGLAVDGRSLLNGTPEVPSWMRAELARLRVAYPAFFFSIRPGWRGLMFEAWRDAGASGLYAVITQDAGELWRELGASQGGLRPVAGTCGNEGR